MTYYEQILKGIKFSDITSILLIDFDEKFTEHMQKEFPHASITLCTQELIDILKEDILKWDIPAWDLILAHQPDGGAWDGEFLRTLGIHLVHGCGCYRCLVHGDEEMERANEALFGAWFGEIRLVSKTIAPLTQMADIVLEAYNMNFQVVCLQAQYTPEIRKELGRLLTRIEFDVDRAESLAEFSQLRERYHIEEEYLRNFINMATIHNEAVLEMVGL